MVSTNPLHAFAHLFFGDTEDGGIASRKLAPRLIPEEYPRFTVVTGTPFRRSPVLTIWLRFGLVLYPEE